MSDSTFPNPSTRQGYQPLDPAAPAWLRDIARFFAIRSQFVLSGNINDLVLMPAAGGWWPVTLREALAALLEVY